jgi:hypothetical protein
MECLRKCFGLFLSFSLHRKLNTPDCEEKAAQRHDLGQWRRVETSWADEGGFISHGAFKNW